jgi:hypothetical protein
MGLNDSDTHMNDTPHPPALQPGGHGATARPWTVTSAAVIAFVLAALWLLAAIASFEFAVANAQLEVGTAVRRAVAVGAFVAGLLYVVFAALLIWCGVRALRGVTSRSLFVAALAIIILSAISGAAGAALGVGDIGHWGNAGNVVLLVIIIALLMQQSSRQFFRSRGGVAI